MNSYRELFLFFLTPNMVRYDRAKLDLGISESCLLVADVTSKSISNSISTFFFSFLFVIGGRLLMLMRVIMCGLIYEALM